MQLARFSVGMLVVLTAANTAFSAPVFVGTAVRGDIEGAHARFLAERVAGALDVGGVEDVSGQREGASHASTSTQLLDAVDEARRRYKAADFERAISGCDDAIARFEDGPAYGPDAATWRALTDVLVLRALALARVDREREGKETVRRLLVLRPKFEADPADVPPDFRDIVEAMRRAVQRPGGGALDVSSAPPGATIIVDGVEVGETPMRLENLPRGRHYVAVVGEGDRHTRRIEIGTDDVRVDARLGDPRRIAARVVVQALSTGLQEQQLVELSGAVAPDVVVAVVAPGADGLRVVLGRVRKGKLSTVAGAVLPTDDDDVDHALAKLATTIEAGQPGGDDEQRALLLSGTEEADLTPLVIGFSVAAGAIILAAGVTGIVLAVLGRAEAEQGFYVSVDSSRL